MDAFHKLVPAWIAVGLMLLAGGHTNAQSSTATSCPKSPRVGQTATVKGRIARLDKTGNQGVIFVNNCRVVIFARGDLRKCRRGATISARGKVQLYDLYPTMETFFINPSTVICT